jgi:hypothetical protein
MSQYFKKNIQLLEQNSPSAKMLKESLPASVKLKTTSTGENTVWLNSILIHSMYDPVKEGQMFSNEIKEDSQVCLYGFGLGYHIESILKKIGPNGNLLVIELNPDLLQSAIILRDQSLTFKDDRFDLVFGLDEETVSMEITTHMKRMQIKEPENLKVLFHMPSFKCIPSNFPKLTNSLEVLLMERRFIAVLGKTEKKNYKLNKKIVEQSNGISNLNSSHMGKPGLLFSAGPSLDNILPYLKQIDKNFVIACVDTTLPILSREKITPNYVFSLDPQEDSFQYFQGYLDSSAKLIFTPTANTKVVHCYKGEKFIVFKSKLSSSNKEIFNINNKDSTQSGGSVSCLALDSLIKFGCDPIFLIGQDLSFPNNRIYSSFSNSNTHMMDELGNGSFLDQTHYTKSRKDKTISVETNSGSEVVTNQAMYSYLRAIEEIVEANPQTKIYNLCSHGAKIHNTVSLGSASELVRFLISH